MKNRNGHCFSEYAFEYGSREFWQSVELRQRVLREPLGLTLTVRELLAECAPVVHYGLFELLDEQTTAPIIACACALPLADEIWQIRQVAVVPLYRGRGFGSRVMIGLEEHLRLHGAAGTCLHARRNVQEFYEKLGYKVTGEPFEEIGLPHVRMEK